MQHLQIESFRLKSKTHMDLRSRLQSLDFASERTDLTEEEATELAKLRVEFARSGEELASQWEELNSRHQALVDAYAQKQIDRLEKKLQVDSPERKNWKDSWTSQLSGWQDLRNGHPVSNAWWLFGLVPGED